MGEATDIGCDPDCVELFQSTLPVGEATLPGHTVPLPRLAFQSTLPVGEATPDNISTEVIPSNFNPRFPWGKRRIA